MRRNVKTGWLKAVCACAAIPLLPSCTTVLGDFTSGSVVADATTDAPAMPSTDAGDGSFPAIPDAGVDATTGDAARDATGFVDATLPTDAPFVNDGATVRDANADALSLPDGGGGCSNACTLGAPQCSSGATQTCVTGDAGCTVWVVETCGVHESCGIVDAASVCACTNPGLCANRITGNLCNGPGGYVTCDEDDAGCFFQVDAATCPIHEQCGGANGSAACSLSCKDQCSIGEAECNGASLSPCTAGDAGCNVWGAGAACPTYMQCGGGTTDAGCVCAPNACTSARATPGALVCTDGGAYATCETDTTSGCLVPTPGADTACASGASCPSGAVISSCTCSGTNAPQCGNSCCPAVETCGTGGSCVCPNGGTLCSTTGGSALCCGAGSVCGTSGGCALPTGSGGVTTVGASTLALWLTADQGLACSGGYATDWLDQSGHGHNAGTKTAGPGPSGNAVGVHVGPLCNAPGHTLNNIPVPYFNAPDGGGLYVAGTMDIDLSFLVATPMTAFVVERRWAGPFINYDGGAQATSLLLGTEIPPADAGLVTSDFMLAMGYVTYNGILETAIDFGGGGSGSEGCWYLTPAGGPVPATIDTAQTSSTGAEAFYMNGVLQGGSRTSDVTPTQISVGAMPYPKYGTIGGGLSFSGAGSDYRLNGDIAEILVFTSTLSTADRNAVEAYLVKHWGGGDAGAFPPPPGAAGTGGCK